MDLGLENKVAIVTGAASPGGIGAAIARSLAREGARVAVSDINPEGLQELVRGLRENGLEALSITADQAELNDVSEAVTTVKRALGGVDILVNAAAVTNNLGSITRMPPDNWYRELDVNLHGPYHWIREAVPLMREKAWGRILNISSVRGLFGGFGTPSYAVSKGGLHTLTHQAARENAARGITVNSLVLGAIETDIYSKNQYSEKEIEWLRAHIPLQRMGLPEEVASAATFLCSEPASYITGALLNVDGAMSISI
jgi:NAD(P)-dependent dehydrogenase (short-subunit alcohol dehydrogenase family)